MSHALRCQSEGLLRSPDGLHSLAKNLKGKLKTLAPEAAEHACSRDDILWKFSMVQKNKSLVTAKVCNKRGS